MGETAKKGKGMTSGIKETLWWLELQAPTMLPACPKFIFIPPPRHQSNTASAADPDCNSFYVYSTQLG